MLLLALLITAAPASPEESLAAARKQIVGGDFVRTLSALDTAILQAPPPKVSAQLQVLRAQCFLALRSPEKARAALEAAVAADPEVSVDPDRTGPALVNLLSHVRGTVTGNLVVQVTGASARVLLDGKPLGEAPLTAPVPVGKHVVSVQPADGRAALQREVTVSTGGAQLTFGFDEVSGPPLVRTPTSVEQDAAADEPGYGGLAVFAGLDGDVVGRGLSPTVTAELSHEWVGGAAAVIIAPSPGARLEARLFPAELGRFRPHLALGATAFASGVALRGGAGLTLRLGRVRLAVQGAYEHYLAESAGYPRTAVLISGGAGWQF